MIYLKSTYKLSLIDKNFDYYNPSPSPSPSHHRRRARQKAGRDATLFVKGGWS